MHYHSEYAKLIFAEKAISECSEYLQLFKDGYKANNRKRTIFERATSKAFIITYAKPFLASNKGTKEGYGSGSISTKWLSSCEAEIKTTHHQIVKLSRHLWVAHTNLALAEPEIKLTGPMQQMVSSSQEYFLDEFGLSTLNKLLILCDNSIHSKMDIIRKQIGNCEFKL